MQFAYLSLPISTLASPFHVRNRRLNIKCSILSALRALRSLSAIRCSALFRTLHRKSQATLHSSICGAKGTRVTARCSSRLDRFSIPACYLEARSAQSITPNSRLRRLIDKSLTKFLARRSTFSFLIGGDQKDAATGRPEPSICIAVSSFVTQNASTIDQPLSLRQC